MEILRLPVGALRTNCYLVLDESGEALVIDPGAEAQRILATLREKEQKVGLILLTHAHADHMLALAELKEATGAPLALTKAEAPALHDPGKNLIGMFSGETLGEFEADRMLEEKEEFSVGGMRFRTILTPGHTPGSACYLCGEFLFTGDTLFAGGVGRTDFPGGDFHALRQSLDKLAALPGDYTLLPGHDRQTTLGAERATNPYMTDAYFD